MKTVHWGSLAIGLAAGMAIGAVSVSTIARGQNVKTTTTMVPVTPLPATPPPANVTTQVSGTTLAVGAIGEKGFVVVKDHGDFQTTMYYSVEAGIPVLKQNAKYMYRK